MYHIVLARGFFIFAVFACAFAMFGWGTESDMWLASTQWMLVAIFLLVLAVYIRISEEDDMKELGKRTRTVKKNGNEKKNGKDQDHKSFVLTDE